ncbi:MAG: UvrD-helicase domain-containing protein [Gemmatimonadaceae bacterium]|nr:UvrD-helicase domain-containing protein [Gemmatimonadaceae bacterium]
MSHVSPFPTPSPSQQRAIEAPPRAMLVLAGPGAGKTFCLTERIRFLIQSGGIPPERICAFTFTNKAAGEIGHRLASRRGDQAAAITCGTLHAFCAELLRVHAASAGLEPGFGIADEAYQLSVLRRLEGPRKWHRTTLTRFSSFRFRQEPLLYNDRQMFDRYEQFLAQRNLVDFDQLVIRAAELLETADVASEIRARWDVVLVDEFQDLNPVQYRVVRALARDHRHVFAVGDDDQSIYSWAGADSAVFKTFVNDFGVTTKVHLEENRRCPQNVFAVARKLVTVNTPIFADRVSATADRASTFPVQALRFPDDEHEAAWLADDIASDRAEYGHAWGDIAVLYRTHAIGALLEAACLNSGVPCRLATGRALADDPVVAYVLAAARVIASPKDDLLRQAFFRHLLPSPLFDEAFAKAEERGVSLTQQLVRMAAHMQRGDERARQIRRALADDRNLAAIGAQHDSLIGLLHALLSRKVGVTKSILDDHHDEITDPAQLPAAVALAELLGRARATRAPLWLPICGGVEIPLVAMLGALGISAALYGVRPPSVDVDPTTAHPSRAPWPTTPPTDALVVAPDAGTGMTLALTLFKAAQVLEMRDASAGFRDFTAIDLETTDRDVHNAEIIEIAAVRVRDGEIVEHYHAMVQPRVAIAPGALATHGIDAAALQDAPFFEAVWPEVKRFIDRDVIVAHNGYDFDFPILERMVSTLDERFDLTTFDSLPIARDLFPTSRKLVDLARRFGIDAGQSHRALDDTLALAKVTVALGVAQAERARKTALNEHLGALGVALAVTQQVGAEPLDDESALFLRLTRVFALGKFSGALEHYEQARGDNADMPTVDDVIAALGGQALMDRIRTEKTAEDRYPQAMLRLRRLIAELPAGDFHDQLAIFLERAVLSKWDGEVPDPDRVNLLTLHSTKGLEFSRVYVVGAEDAQLPGGSPTKGPSAHEIEEGRRLLYVGMTRTIDRLVLTTTETRAGKPTGGHQFLDEMGLTPMWQH